MTVQRMWINQPSTHQPLHHLHGTRVLARIESKNVALAYFLSGSVISQQIPLTALSQGWPGCGTSKIEILLADIEASLMAIEAYGFKLVTWPEFVEATDRPEGLMARAVRLTRTQPDRRSWVVFDPTDDCDGWMLIGERDGIIRETVRDLTSMEPPEGPLSPKELA